jgi:fused signal recognition particle receptor
VIVVYTNPLDLKRAHTRKFAMFDFLKKKPKDKPEDLKPENASIEPVSVNESPEPDKKEAPPTRESWLQKLKNGLSRTREKVQEKVQAIAAARRGIDDKFYDEILEILIETDMGMEPAEEIIKQLSREVGARGARDTKEACDLLIELIGRMLTSETVSMTPEILEKKDIAKPMVLLLTGVNGSGKTTVCGKLSKRFKLQGYKVLLVAADTFRAAAIDQLRVWGERAEVDFSAAKESQDPSSVVFDGLTRAKTEGYDVVIIDTAGRLQNKISLMNELGKIRRTVDKQIPEGAVQSLLVIDSTTGQNAISQAEVFGEVAKLDGIVLTKLDGTARGGIVLSIKSRMKLPVLEVGVGEGIDDLVPFDSATYARSLLGDLAGDEINWRERVGYSD